MNLYFLAVFGLCHLEVTSEGVAQEYRFAVKPILVLQIQWIYSLVIFKYIMQVYPCSETFVGEQPGV